jgi:hypothetical protein
MSGVGNVCAGPGMPDDGVDELARPMPDFAERAG